MRLVDHQQTQVPVGLGLGLGLALLGGLASAQGEGQQGLDPYAPSFTECPSNLRVRAADVRGTNEISNI